MNSFEQAKNGAEGSRRFLLSDKLLVSETTACLRAHV